MYFVPMFDETSGYYDSGTGVSGFGIMYSCSIQKLTLFSGGLNGAISSTGSLAGNPHGPWLETGAVPIVAACLRTCLL